MKSRKWLALLTAVCASVSFASCGGNGGNGHTHAYTEKKTTDEYLKTVADCNNPATYWYSCACGEIGTETYSVGEALGHHYEDGVCGSCSDICAHTQTEWETDVEASCFTDGVKKLVCADCEEVLDNGVIEATGHTFENGACTVCNADLWDGTASVDWYTGDKAEYNIYTAEQLAGVAKLSLESNTTFENVTITLCNNIELDGKEWTPIGSNYSNWFMGTFNGNGKAVSNMKITASHNYAGLFGRVAPQGKIKDFTLYNVDINIGSGYCSVGGLVGVCSGEAENCGVTGKISVGASMSTTEATTTCSVGGAFGNVSKATNVFADCDVQNIYDSVPTQITIQRQIGGFAGSVSQADNCYALGNVVYDCQAEIDYDKVNYNVETLALVGGFSGKGSGAISNCYATGDVTATGTFISYVGGFIGRFSGSVSSSYATGNVTVNSCDNILAGGYTGGFIGEVEIGCVGMIEYVYATGNVVMKAKTSSDVGGLIGRNSSTSMGKKIACSYATGNVSLEGGRQCAIGGLIGANNMYEVEKSYATGDVTIVCKDDTIMTSNSLMNCEAGGLIGRTTGNVSNAYATGDVSATATTDGEVRIYIYAGGLIANVKDTQLNSSYSEKVTVSNTYASGDVSLTVGAVSGNHYSYPAGLIAYLDYAKVSHSFATGNVQRTMNTNGNGCYISPLVGKNVEGGQRKVENCYVPKGLKQITTVGGERTETLSEEYPISGQLPSFIELENLQKAGFYMGTLGWSTDVWNLTDGECPTLYW